MPATPPLTADFLSSLSPRRRHHKSWTNFQPLKEGLLNAKYGIGAGVFQLSAVSTWRNDGSEEFHFCLFSPSACYQRLFFFFLSRWLLIFGPFHVLSHPRRPSARSHPAVVSEGGAGGERGSLPPLYTPSNGAPWIRRAHALGAHMGACVSKRPDLPSPTQKTGEWQ